jgi:hypothetical protein
MLNCDSNGKMNRDTELNGELDEFKKQSKTERDEGRGKRRRDASVDSR